MSLRWPARPSNSSAAVVNPLELEIAAEKASALGRAGEKAERCLAELRAAGRDSPQRAALLKDAADAVYAYFIQRELCGLRRHHQIIREYDIPNEVLARLGAR
ncbi:MAG: hypothetical protein J0H34_19490 [Rhizobiales bacterium]|nr:hypothetical protein [Hyphomicrobiales bacterium]